VTLKNQRLKIAPPAKPLATHGKNQKLPKLPRKPSLPKPSGPSKPSLLSSPQTMEELVAMYGEKVRGFKRGEEIEGKVTAIAGKNIYFDIGGKTEGVVLGREFEACREFIKTLKVGDKVKLRVGNPENERGQILLNLRKTTHDFAWNFFEEKLKSGEEIEVKGRELNKGGLVAIAPFSLQGFIPGSQLGTAWQGKQQTLINRPLKVKVIEVNRKDNRLVFSERLVSDAEKIAAEEKLLKKVKIGEIYDGEVVQVMPYGLIVSIELPPAKRDPAPRDKSSKLSGLVHISEVSWGKVDDLQELYQVGDKVKVKTLKIEGNKLQLSIKQLTPDPWEKLKAGETPIKGVVRRLAAYGALIELKPGIEGLLHISKIPPDYKIDVGDKISCFIESVDKENRKLSLGLVLKKKPVGYK